MEKFDLLDWRWRCGADFDKSLVFVFSGIGKLVLSSSENMALFSFFSLECLSLFEFVSFLEILWPSPAVNMSLISYGE